MDGHGGLADTFVLQLHHNIIVLGGMDIRDSKMSVSLHLILLNQRKFGPITDKNLWDWMR